jgi:Phytanoyl-CoA dioxygenase (PhyH)
VARLSDGEIAHYVDRGYLIPSFRLPQAKVDRLRESLDRLIRDNPGVRPEKLVSAHVVGQGQGANPEGVKGSKDFLDLAMEPHILDMVEQLIGPDIILWGCHVFCKPAGDGHETPWHQDGHYWPIRPLANCTVWVALEESSTANGCLRVIPRSHVGKQLHEHLHEDRSDLTLNQRLAAGTFDEAGAVDLELQPGEMSLHDVYMIHGAKENRSSRRRTGVALRYMPATSVFERDLRPVDGKTGLAVDFANRALWLVKGTDCSGRNDLDIGHRR